MEMKTAAETRNEKLMLQLMNEIEAIDNFKKYAFEGTRPGAEFNLAEIFISFEGKMYDNHQIMIIMENFWQQDTLKAS